VKPRRREPTAALAAWVARTPRIRSRRAIALAKGALKDIVACMVAGARDEATLRVSKAARGWGPPSAALIYGTAAHALDYDDNYHPMAGHATAVLAPAIFSIAESKGASGAAVLDAYIVGLEALALVGNGVNLVHYERGWHSTSTIGPFGAAAACARLLGLDARGVTAALSLAFSMASGSKLQFGTMAKPVHAGLAAQHGVMAATLAASGVRGIVEPLEGHWGFRELFAGAESPGYRPQDIGRPLAIERYGLKAKIHPCCASVHTAVDALIFLRTKHQFTAEDVESIEVLVNQVSYDNLQYPDPKTDTEARFSMQWAMALALLQGRLGLADFTPAALKRRELRAWVPRIRMRHTRAGQAHPSLENGREPALTTVWLKSGKKLSRYAQRPKGTLQIPLSAAELDAKFEDCAPGRPALGRLLDRLESVRDIRTLMALMRRPSPPPLPLPRRSPSASRGAPGRLQ
jgi:2-methylcitrate dehydratase PrpD